MDTKTSDGYTYGKRPLWQWILLYIVIGAVVYGLIYYFILAKNGSMYGANQTGQQTVQQSQPATGNTVQVENFAFSPQTLTVKAGDTVTWENKDSAAHQMVADDNSFDTGVISQGQTGSVTFSKAGTVTYHCSIHPTMKGTIVVQ